MNIVSLHQDLDFGNQRALWFCYSCYLFICLYLAWFEYPLLPLSYNEFCPRNLYL